MPEKEILMLNKNQMNAQEQSMSKSFNSIVA
jgi:hypothetical protein